EIVFLPLITVKELLIGNRPSAIENEVRQKDLIPVVEKVSVGFLIHHIAGVEADPVWRIVGSVQLMHIHGPAWTIGIPGARTFFNRHLFSGNELRTMQEQRKGVVGVGRIAR